MDVSKEFIRCLEIEHDIMLLENQIKNLTQEKDKLVKELEHLKEQEKVGKNKINPSPERADGRKKPSLAIRLLQTEENGSRRK